MNDNRTPPRDLTQASGFLGNLIRQGRLVWRLFGDRRVPGWVKLIPIAGVIYLLSPIDLVPDFLIPGLGELDDLTVILLSMKAFVDLSPPDIVNAHLKDLLGRARRSRSEPEAYIDVPYRVVDDDDQSKE